MVKFLFTVNSEGVFFYWCSERFCFFTEEHKNKFMKPVSFRSCFYKQNTVVVRGIPIRMDGGNLVVISGKKWLAV